MPQRKKTQAEALNSFARASGMPPFLNNPFVSILAEMSGSFLESVATAQKDWMDFVHKRIKEDVGVFRQLMRSQSLAEMHRVYSEYLQTTVEAYQKQSERVVHRGESMAQHLAETMEGAAKEGARARH